MNVLRQCSTLDFVSNLATMCWLFAFVEELLYLVYSDSVNKFACVSRHPFAGIRHHLVLAFISFVCISVWRWRPACGRYERLERSERRLQVLHERRGRPTSITMDPRWADSFGNVLFPVPFLLFWFWNCWQMNVGRHRRRLSVQLFDEHSSRRGLQRNKAGNEANACKTRTDC